MFELVDPLMATAMAVAGGVALVALYIFSVRYIFRVNEQTLYLKQICQELMKLNTQKDGQ